MEEYLSPIVRKIAREVINKPRRSSSTLTEVCLEDWWLAKADDGNGIAVGGRPIEMRKCDNTWREFRSAPTKKRYASREFHSKPIVKRHGCTTVESSDGMTVYLCGFINRSRTRHNGFSSEICRDFIYGFPFNWEDYAAQSVAEESSETNHEYSTKCLLPAALELYNGAQLHDLVLSLTDSERDVFGKRIYDNLIEMLDPQTIDRINAQPSKSSPSSPIDKGILTDMSSIKRASKRQKQTGFINASTTKEPGHASISSRRAEENLPCSSESDNHGLLYDVTQRRKMKLSETL